MVAQYLNNKYKINIHADNECAFRYACEKGHLEIAKWLRTLGNETGTPLILMLIINLFIDYTLYDNYKIIIVIKIEL